MTLLKIARMGHPVLVRRAEEIPDPTTREIRALIEDMVETMTDARGVGLAAPQVHIPKRVIIFNAPRTRGEADAPETEFAPLTALINPEIEVLDEEQELGWEGCLSIPGLTGAVPRYRRIRYSGLAPTGKRISREATGFHARVVQHECDHLDGVLYTMRMTDLSLLSFTDELQRLAGAAAEESPVDDGEDC
ncbi:MAG: peptide deformylase [Rhodospirillaceae bacterium]